MKWLGEIPEHWEVHQFKRICRLSYGHSLSADMRTGGTVPVVGSNGRVGSHTQANTSPPCIVVGRKGSFGKVNYYGESVFAIDTTFFVDHHLTPTHIRWLYFLLGSLHLDTVTKDSAVPGLDREDVYGLPVPVPHQAEQLAIAKFLDRETAKIDILLEKHEELIQLLQEKRGALISHAVTKGLDPAVPMTDSGVDWLGEIPAHWEAKRTKFVATLRSGHTPSRQKAEYWEDCTIPWFGLADIWQVREGGVEYVHQTAEKISEVGLANSSARLLPKDTVILSRTASVGFSTILGVDMATTQDFVNWICGQSLRPEYLLYVFRAMGSEFRRLTMGSTHQTIYMHDVGDFSTPVPPLPEQDRIVAVVRSETVAIDGLIAKARQAIERLEELRTALISAVVTGKVDVREVVA